MVLLNKISTYILITGVITCGFLMSNSTFDRTLVVRHVVLCVLTAALAFVSLFLKRKKYITPKYSALQYAFLIYCLMSIVSIIKAVNYSEVIYAILTPCIYFSLFFCITHSPVSIGKRTLTKAMMYFGLVFALYGIYELSQISFDRITETDCLGFANHRNMWAATLMLLLPFSIYSFFKKFDLVSLMSTVLLFICIFLLQTRSVYAALVVATLVTIFMYKKILVLPLCLIMVMTFLCLPGRLKSSTSLGYRFQMWGKTLDMFYSNPIFGIGAGQWMIQIPEYGNDYYTEKGEQKQIFHQRPHNDFLEVLSETGFIGGLSYLSIFLIAMYYSTKIKDDKVLAWTMRYGIISYVVFASLSYPKERALHSILVLLMLSLLTKEYLKFKKVFSYRDKCIYVIIFLITIPALFFNYHRYKAECYGRDAMIYKSMAYWPGVIEVIDRNYSPHANMVNYAVTPILQYRAEANLKLGNHKEAYLDLLKAEKLHPNHVVILNNLGLYSLLYDSKEAAYNYYVRGNKIYPERIKIPTYLIPKKGNQK